jgi:hypothetical protein
MIDEILILLPDRYDCTRDDFLLIRNLRPSMLREPIWERAARLTTLSLIGIAEIVIRTGR